MVRIATALSMILLLSTVLSGLCFAGQCSNGPCCNQSGIKGPIVRPKHNVGEEGKGDMNLSGFSVLSGILAIGQGLRAGSNQISAAFDKNFEAQDAYLRQLITSFGVARDRANNLDEFGSKAGAYNTLSGDYSAQATAGIIATDRVSLKMRNDFQDYLRSFKRRKQIFDRLQDAPTGYDFKTGETLTASELAKNKEVVKTILDPYPALTLNKNLEQKKTTRDYKSEKKAKEAKLLIPTAILSDYLATRSPTIEAGGWFDEAYQKMGGQGDSGKALNGNISMNGLLSMLTDMRFANQDWAVGQDGLHGKTRAGVLRELLLSEIDKLMVEYQKLRWVDRMAAVMAQKQLSRNNEFNQALKHAQINALQ